jgi:DNA-binding beta-propeller fold protein YncE
MNKFLLPICILFFLGCKKTTTDTTPMLIEDASTFKEIASLTIGGPGAAEISTYDPLTKRLFTVNNSTTNQIDVIDFANPASPQKIAIINLTIYGGAVNSLDVRDGKLAAALEASVKQDAGKVVVFNTTTYAEVKVITVGALPDMVTYSPDGNFILTANEAEPSADYTNDPAGTVSIIMVNQNYAVTTIDFSAFLSQQNTLMSNGLRIFSPTNNFVNDIEPEYITVAEDSKTAWITLQENNAIAVLDLVTKTFTKILPLGFKDYNAADNKIDVSDLDNAKNLANWQVKGMYQPDAIAVLNNNGMPYLFTANEGDAREYNAFSEVKRVKTLNLDAAVFPNAAALKLDPQMGRLNVTNKLGDIDNDGDMDVLYSFGARSFSVWNGLTGSLVYDSKNELDAKAIAENVYDDARSDDKGAEPEGITIGKVGNKTIAFIGLERVDAVALYDVTIPTNPVFIKMLKCGDAPEGVLFIPASKSPINESLLVVSSENDGVIKVYKADKF